MNYEIGKDIKFTLSITAMRWLEWSTRCIHWWGARFQMCWLNCHVDHATSSFPTLLKIGQEKGINFQGDSRYWIDSISTLQLNASAWEQDLTCWGSPYQVVIVNNKHWWMWTCVRNQTQSNRKIWSWWLTRQTSTIQTSIIWWDDKNDDSSTFQFSSAFFSSSTRTAVNDSWWNPVMMLNVGLQGSSITTLLLWLSCSMKYNGKDWAIRVSKSRASDWAALL